MISLEEIRWGGDGRRAYKRIYRCPKCGCKEYWRASTTSRTWDYYTRVCKKCRHATSLTAGTILDGLRISKPNRLWIIEKAIDVMWNHRKEECRTGARLTVSEFRRRLGQKMKHETAARLLAIMKELVPLTQRLHIDQDAFFSTESIDRVRKRQARSRRTEGGGSNLIYSAHQATNDQVFPHILNLFVPAGSKVADVTFGTGVFWRHVDISKYDLHPSDIRTSGLPTGCQPNVDSRRLPYEDGSFDAVVFDPPYMHAPSSTAHQGYQGFDEYYGNNLQGNSPPSQVSTGNSETAPKYHEAILDLYFRSAQEAWRVLKNDGIYIVKCQDEVCSRRQHLTHIEITNKLGEFGFAAVDLFVVVRKDKPGVSRMAGCQSHARKNHSYFMVYKKPAGVCRPHGLGDGQR